MQVERRCIGAGAEVRGAEVQIHIEVQRLGRCRGANNDKHARGRAYLSGR